MAVVLAPSAAAHDTLTSASPVQDAVVEDAPTEVVLTFSAEVLDLPTSMIVTGPNGEVVAEGTPTIDGRSVALDLPSSLPDGTYDVTWSVVSSDGHRTEDGYTFALAAGGPVSDPGPTSESTQQSQTPTAESMEEGPAASPESDYDSSGRPAPGLPTWRTIIIVQVGIVAFAVAVALVYRRWHGSRSTANGEQDT